MAVEKLEFIERRLGVSGKLLIAPVFILLLFALVTFYSIREFQSLDARMDTVARDLAPETAVATGVLINLYTMRLRVFDYYATGNEDILARFEQLETDFFRELSAAQQTIKSADRVQLVAEIEEATLQYANVFKSELVPAKQQVKNIIADELDQYGPTASEALRRAIDGVTNREPDSRLRVVLEQLIHDTLMMRMASQRFFADGDESSETAIGLCHGGYFRCARVSGHGFGPRLRQAVFRYRDSGTREIPGFGQRAAGSAKGDDPNKGRQA
ncbi:MULTISPECIES: MCP four helix bundle domain-containing protein [Marinobacter]|uniref:MCP four helix bundle domain-containing protein n=1 Tax=Marinobacter TaxID=2742 RepID=UPI002942B267|nr:MCP four helix bundle domain-containing protein [Marinobacter salarius]WOI18029.1 MCP four helix bundle domain-containing protein [Marinobacter salarius]